MTNYTQENINEHLLIMRRQEDSNIYMCEDYLEMHSQSQSQPQRADGTIDELCRSKMTQWCYQVIDYIKFRRETVSVAMNYLDRFLCTGCARAEKVMHCRKEYQLAAMTALFMAIKINEPVMIDMTLLTELSKGLYTKADFEQMETDILFGLNWRVNGPTAQSFVVHILSLMQQGQDQDQHTIYDYQRLLDLASYQIELSVGEYELVTQKPSVVAAASIWNSVEENTTTSISSLKFRNRFLDLISSFDIQIDSIYKTKACLYTLKHTSCASQPNKIQMRVSPITTEQFQQQQQLQHGPQQQHSPRSSATSPASSTTAHAKQQQTQNNSNVPQSYTKSDKRHSSPSCVSKRKLQIK